MTRTNGDLIAPSPNRLYRDPANGILLGVCAGIAAYFGVQPWVVRLGTVFALLLFAPPTVVIYLVLGAVLPRAPEALYKNRDEERFWRGVRVDPSRSFSELRHRFQKLELQLKQMEAYVTSEAYRVDREINSLDR